MCISWDLKNGVDTMHATLAQTRPSVGARAHPPGADAQDDHRDAAAAAHYVHNPHMQRALALTKRDHAAGLRREVVHQAAHSLPDQDARVHTIPRPG